MTVKNLIICQESYMTVKNLSQESYMICQEFYIICQEFYMTYQESHMTVKNLT